MKIEKVLIENLTPEVIETDTLYFVKDGDTVSMKLTDKDNTILNPVSENKDFPCLLGFNFVFIGMKNTYFVSNFSTDKVYNVSSGKGLIETNRNENGFWFTYEGTDLGPDTITINNRVIDITVKPLPILQPVTIEVVSGTVENFSDPFIVRVSDLVSDTPMKSKVLNFSIYENEIVDPSRTFTTAVPADGLINLTNILGSYFKPSSLYIFKATYTAEYKNPIYFTTPDSTQLVVTTERFMYPTYISNKQYNANNISYRYQGRESAASQSLDVIIASEHSYEDTDFNVILNFYKRSLSTIISDQRLVLPVTATFSDPNYLSMGYEATSCIYLNKSKTFAAIATSGAGVFVIKSVNGIWEQDSYIEELGTAYPSQIYKNGCYINETGDLLALSVIDKYVTSMQDGLIDSYVHIYRRVNNVWVKEQTLSQPTLPANGAQWVNGEAILRNDIVYPQGRFGSRIILSDNAQDLFISSPWYYLDFSGETQYVRGKVYHYKLNGTYQLYKVIENPNKVNSFEKYFAFNGFGLSLKLSPDNSKLFIGSEDGLMVYDIMSETSKLITIRPGANGGNNFWTSSDSSRIYISSESSNGWSGAIFTYVLDSNGQYQLKSEINNYFIEFVTMGGIHGCDEDSLTIAFSHTSRAYDTEGNTIYDAGQMIEFR